MTVAAVRDNNPLAAGADGSLIVVTWVLTTADPKGQAVCIPEWYDRTWHAYGTIGGATLAIETAQTNTDAQFAACKNAAGGAAIAITSLPACAVNIENSMFIRPNLSTVGVGATVNVMLVARRMNPLRT